MSEKQKNRVLLLGFDAADWKLIRPLMEAGEMPRLQSLVDQGIQGNLRTLRPPISPLLWTSIATGKHGDRHGILGFAEPRADRRGIQPTSSLSRRCPALWNLISQQGKRASVVNWYASHPAEQVNGTIVSNLFPIPQGSGFEDWPLPQQSISPPQREQDFHDLRIHPADLSPEFVERFIPHFREIDLEKDPRPLRLIRHLAQFYTVHAAGTHLAEHEDWDFLGVFYESIDHLSHEFMEFHPPRMAHIAEADFEIYQNVMNEVYRYHDAILGRYLDLVDEDTTVILLSDHGFHSDALRPSGSSSTQHDPLAWHRENGILAARGPQLKHGATANGMTLLDIAPTILGLLDLEIPSDLDGNVLRQWWQTPPSLCYRPPSESTGETKVPLISNEAEKVALSQLADLGYLPNPNESHEELIRQCRFTNATTLTVIKLTRNDFSGAKESAQQALDLATTASEKDSASRLLTVALFQNSEWKECEQTLANRQGSTTWNSFRTRMNVKLALARGKPDLALELLGSQDSPPATSSFACLEFAECHAHLRQWQQVHHWAEAALKLDNEDSSAWYWLGKAHYHNDRLSEAVEALSRAIALQYFFPEAHYHLGLAVATLGYPTWAKQALSIAVEQQPDFARPHLALARLYTKAKHLFQAQGHQFLAEQIQGHRPAATRTTPHATRNFPAPASEPIVIVTGIPRSGTSLVMQMLQAAKIELFHDEHRPADEFNPRGYWEWEGVTQLKDKPESLAPAVGKALKVVSPLLPTLPTSYRYQVIHVTRDLKEVVASQIQMREQGPTKDAEQTKKLLLEYYSRHRDETKRWLEQQPNIESIEFTFRDILTEPEIAARQLARFLQIEPDIQKVSETVDTNLYRQRIDSP